MPFYGNKCWKNSNFIFDVLSSNFLIKPFHSQVLCSKGYQVSKKTLVFRGFDLVIYLKNIQVMLECSGFENSLWVDN